jgi:hypothetical protein
MGRYVLEIVGFTDKSGQQDYNLALSQRRADAVLRYLVDHNVPLRRIHMIGLGADQAAVEGEAAPASRKAQRRVAVKIWIAPEPTVTASVTPAPPQTASQPPASQPTHPEPQTKP